ncbi:MAG: polyprenyl synthetase family protein [Patescibacteria group bacterium]
MSTDAKKLITEFKKRLDPEIKAFFAEVKKDAEMKDPFIREAVDHMEDIVVSGGKRLRAALMYYSYLASGGTNREAILKASVSVELIHAFLLVHDDIIDRDNLRHGVPTLHARYKEKAKKYFPDKDEEHFGNSIAIILGDMLYAFGNDVIFRADFPKEAIFRALMCLQKIVTCTVTGQARDIYIEFQGSASEEEILSMYENKTARYSIEGPLHLGAMLAGENQELLDLYSKYAIPLGIAYQIQDDILGVFGQQKAIGKPIGSDIQEGKYTLLVAKAVELGTKEQVIRIKDLLSGKRVLGQKDFEEFREILEKTGSLVACRAIAEEATSKSLAVLPELKLHMTEEAFDFLEALTNYLLERDI